MYTLPTTKNQSVSARHLPSCFLSHLSHIDLSIKEQPPLPTWGLGLKTLSLLKLGGELEEPLPKNHFWNVERPCLSDLAWEKLPSPVLALFTSLDFSFNFSYSICLCMHHETIDVHAMIIIVRHFLTTISNTPIKNLLILALAYATIVGAYLDIELTLENILLQSWFLDEV